MTSFKKLPAGLHPSQARWNQLRFHMNNFREDDNGVVTAQLADWSPRTPSPITITKVTDIKSKFSYADRNKLALGVKLARRDLDHLRDSSQSLERPQSLENLANRRTKLSTAGNVASGNSKVDRLCRNRPPDKKSSQNKVKPRAVNSARPSTQNVNQNSVGPRRSMSPPVRDTDDWTPNRRKPLHQPTQRVLDNAQASKIRQLQQALKKFEENMELMQLELAAERRENAIKAAKFKGHQPVQQRVENKLKRLSKQAVQYRSHKLYPPASAVTLSRPARSRPLECEEEETTTPRGHHHFENRLFDPSSTAEIEDVYQTAKKLLIAKGRYPEVDQTPRSVDDSSSDRTSRQQLLRNLLAQNVHAKGDPIPPVKPALRVRRSPSPNNKQYRSSFESLPLVPIGKKSDEKLESCEHPEVEEVLYRLDQLEKENEEIRKRWTTLPLEDIGVSGTGEVSAQSIVFTKKPLEKRTDEKNHSVPRQQIPLRLNINTVNRIVNDRNEFQRAMADRMRQSKFTVDVARIGEWLCDDMIDELLGAVVESIDSIGEELANQMFRGEIVDSESEFDDD